jgi:hypothetical protein
MAIVAAEAREQGEHVDGAMFDVETVDGSFVDIDSSMFVQRTQPTGADQASVRPSMLANRMRPSILTVNSLGFASNVTGNPSVRALTTSASGLILYKPEKDDLSLQTRYLIRQ